MPSLLSPVVGRLRKPSPQIRLPPGVSQVSGRSQGSGAPVLDTTPRMLILVWKLCMQMYWERHLLYSSMIFLPLNRGAAPLWHWYSFLHLSLPSFRGSCPIASTAHQHQCRHLIKWVPQTLPYAKFISLCLRPAWFGLITCVNLPCQASSHPTYLSYLPTQTTEHSHFQTTSCGMTRAP